jgi:LAO/AO transport system kinase
VSDKSLIPRLLAGDRRALARVLSLVEDATPAGREALRALYHRTGQAHIVGVTGATGSGKSTLSGALAWEFRRRGRTVAIVAIDPTSPFTHGALLGDRIRMQDLTSDPGVFVRSMATRGALGGLAAATADVVAVLDAAGREVIIIETVGAGQDEVEIAGTALTTVLLVPPSSGDDVQAMKSGILEIAEVIVVNKADLPRANATIIHLEGLASFAPPGSRPVPVLKAVASRNEGIVEIADAIEEHRRYLLATGLIETKQRERARSQLLAAARTAIEERALFHARDRLESLVEAVVERRLDPRSAAEKLLTEVGAY